jgi:hypothetical protein
MKNILVYLVLLVLSSSAHIVADTYYHDPGLKVGKYTTAEEYREILKGNKPSSQERNSDSADYNYDEFNANEPFRLEHPSVASDNLLIGQSGSSGNSEIVNPGSVILPSGALQTTRVAPTRSQGGGLSFSDIVESVQGTSNN